jgi:putative hemolysin
MPGNKAQDAGSHERPERLIDLGATIGNPIGRILFRLIKRPLEQAFSLSAINDLYALASPSTADRTYFATALRTFGVYYDLLPEDLAKIPSTGPLIVVANHPFGAIDGLIMGDILTQARPDFRLLANRLLHRIPEFRPWILPVDVLGDDEATQRNTSQLRLAMKWLAQGGALGVFPAGTVSHLHLRQACIADPAWHRTVAVLARRTGATAITMFFEGHNSLAFQLSGLIHPRLRTALLPSEFLKRSRSRVSVRIGRPIPPHKIARYPDDLTLTDYLRFKTYMLQWRESAIRPRFVPSEPETHLQPLREPQPSRCLHDEVMALPATSLLVEQGDFQVFMATRREIPSSLIEIGRLREQAFRAVHEGTGQPFDLDIFDQHYFHLFLWNTARHEIVGSYRLGRVDDILPQQGGDGLYTNTLFKFKPGFLERLGPALELGRSFVRPEYQGQAAPLSLLWRGIGEYLVRNAECKILFGPVSISQAYAGLSRRLMVEFLSRLRGDHELASLVKARNPPRERLNRQEREALAALVRDTEDVSSLVSDIESDQKGLPMLLRHYLRLGASLLSFNVDEGFGKCIDGLIIVDLRATDPQLLRRYMGNAGYQHYASVAGPAPASSVA